MTSKYKSHLQIIGFLSICIPSLIAPSAWGICVADLQKQVEAVVQSPSLRSARVGVFASKLDGLASPLVNIDGDKYFIPASNIKLFTTAAALELLGENYQIRTSLWIDKKGEHLWVRGGGDPSFTEDNLKSLVKSLVNSFKHKGINTIASEIKTIPELKGSGLGLGWQWQDLQEYYGAIADAFIIYENVLDWTITPTEIDKPVNFSWDNANLAEGWVVENQAITASENTPYSLIVERSLSQKKLTISGQLPQNTPPELGATAIPDPEAHFLRLLRAEIARQGIQFDSAVAPQAQNRPKYPTTEVAEVRSRPLGDLIKTTNKQSNNLYAESLLRRLGTIKTFGTKISEVVPSNPPQSESALGITLVNQFLVRKGISKDSVVIQDGSGLSTLNLATPKAIAQLLIAMKDNMTFRASLPIAGIDGTLRNRFKSTEKSIEKSTNNNLQTANIQAKTGTLTGVNALSGYLKPLQYPELAFSIVVNNSNLYSEELIKNIDEIALLLMTVEECNPANLKL